MVGFEGLDAAVFAAAQEVLGDESEHRSTWFSQEE
jgi:hypothetical protein